MNRKWLVVGCVLICLGITGFSLDQKINNDLGKIVGGCGSGPCFSYGTGNCGFWSGATCSDYPANRCTEGDCGIRCEGTEPSEYCAGLFFACSSQVATCANKLKQNCLPTTYGVCVCKYGSVVGTCSRSKCS